MRRINIMVTILILLMGLLTGCSTNNQGQPQPQAQEQPVPKDLKTSYPLTLVDDVGTTVTIPAKPQRIVSLLPSSTEILCASGPDSSDAVG